MSHPWEDKWTVGDRLGKGGQGITNEVAYNEDPTIRGAIKRLKNNKSSQSRARMRREVASLQALANQGGTVPRVLDDNTDKFEDLSTELFVVMDLITGSTMREYVEANGPLDIDTAIQMVLSLCKTVAIAHSFQILHRDLKPENIIVRNEDTNDLVTVDYGLSFNADDEQLTKTDETFRNSFCDLPETNTPSGDLRDHRSDLTAICALLYFCLTKHVVGQLQDGSGTLPHFRDGYSLRDSISDDARITQVEAFLTRGLSPSVANRFQNIADIIDYLTPLVETSKEIDESDPLQVAAALSDQIRLTDRKTQLTELAQQARILFDYMKNEFSKYHDKLGRFKFAQQGGGFRPEITLPDGLDMVARWNSVLTLQVEHHPHLEHRQYLVGSRGEQCVLLAVDYVINTETPGDFHQTVLQADHVIGRYEGSPEPIYQIASISYREWVTETVKKLAADILPSTEES